MIELFGYMGGNERCAAAIKELLAESGLEYQLLEGSGGMVAAYSPFDNVQLASEDNVVAVLIGRPRKGREEAAQVLVQSFPREGEAALKKLHGSYVGTVFNLLSGQGCAFVDRVGTWPLYYATLPSGGFAYSTRMDVLHRLGVARDHCPQALYDYLYFHVIPGPQTIYEGIRSLRPGRVAMYRKEVEERRYWQLTYQEDSTGNFDDLKQELFCVLESSVDHAADGEVGAFLSGGTDSSTVTGMLGKVRDRSPRTFSIGFDEPGYDELDFARTSGKYFDAEMHEYKVTPEDIVDAIPRIAQAYEQPFGNSSAVPTYFCARMAAETGVNRLLAGDGGDELFAGNTRYAKQHVFHAYSQLLPEGLRQRLVEPLLMGSLGRLPGFSKLRSYVSQAKIPMPERMETYNLLERLGGELVLTEDFLSQIDRRHPLRTLEAAYTDSNAGTLLNRMLTLDYQITLADNDLQKVGRMCALAGVEVAYPLLDDEMVAFAGRVPPEMKLKGNKLRWFFKSAVSDFLPPEVLSKKKQGFGLPFGPWLTRHPGLSELVGDSLSDLRKRGLVRNELIDRLSNELVSDHPGYYGTLVWVLVMLEQWFAANKN